MNTDTARNKSQAGSSVKASAALSAAARPSVAEMLEGAAADFHGSGPASMLRTTPPRVKVEGSHAARGRRGPSSRTA